MPDRFNSTSAPRVTASCTGLAARWCPVHGDCRCLQSGLRPDDGYTWADDLDGPSCPLHAPDSPHPLAPAGLVVFS